MEQLLPVMNSIDKNTRPLPQIPNEVSFISDLFK